MAGDGHGPRLDWMVILTMAAAGACESPPIRLHKLDGIPDLQEASAEQFYHQWATAKLE